MDCIKTEECNMLKTYVMHRKMLIKIRANLGRSFWKVVIVFQ